MPTDGTGEDPYISPDTETLLFEMGLMQTKIDQLKAQNAELQYANMQLQSQVDSLTTSLNSYKNLYATMVKLMVAARTQANAAITFANNDINWAAMYSPAQIRIQLRAALGI